MKIKLTVAWGEYPPGTILDNAHETICKILIGRGHAIRVKDKTPVETTTAEPECERAVKPKAKRRKRR